jgi:hypothetical protein
MGRGTDMPTKYNPSRFVIAGANGHKLAQATNHQTALGEARKLSKQYAFPVHVYNFDTRKLIARFENGVQLKDNPSPKFFAIAGRDDAKSGRVKTRSEFVSAYANDIANTGWLTLDEIYRHYEDGAGLGMREYSRNPANPYDWYDFGWTVGKQDWDAKNVGLYIGDPREIIERRFNDLLSRAMAGESMTQAKQTIAREDFTRGYYHGVEGRPKGKNKGIPKGARRVKSNPKGKRNPESGAAKLVETFTGRPASKVIEVEETTHYHEWLAKLGPLRELKVVLIYAKSPVEVTIGFEKDGVALACNEAGDQIEFIGGNQELDLAKLKLTGKLVKEQMVIGVLVQVEYLCRKKFDKLVLTAYHHGMGEDSGNCPMLLYNTIDKRMSVAGGSYHIEWRGIVD